MQDYRRQDSAEAFRTLISHFAAFSYATGFFITSKKFLEFAPTDPVAVGRVTVEGASKLQDYVAFGYFVVIVPLLTLLLMHWLPRIGRWMSSWVPDGRAPLSIVALASLPLILSPFLYLTTYKELWPVVLSPVLSGLVLAGWVAHQRLEWLRALLHSGDRGAHALVITEGLALLLFRYIAAGERIAHVPSLLLETIFILVFLSLWWGSFGALAFQMAKAAGDVKTGFNRIAVGAFPLVLLPLAGILPVEPAPALVAAAVLASIGVALFTRPRISSPAANLIERLVVWVAVPFLLLALSYASSAHSSGWIDLFHQGESLGPASDYLRGKLPYEGVLPLHGLLQNGLLDAWLMEIFGRSEQVAIARSTVLTALMLPMAWLLAWQVFRSYVASAGSILGTLVLAADNQRAVLEILVILLIVSAMRRGVRYPLFLAGVACAAAFFFSLDIGVYCLVGAPLAFVAISVLERQIDTVRWALMATAILILGVAVGAAPFLWFLGSEQLIRPFLQTSFVTVPGLIDATWSLPFPDLSEWFSKRFPTESFFQLAWHVRFIISPVVLVIAIIVVVRRSLTRSITIDDRILTVLTLFALVTQRSAIGRADIFHHWFAAFLLSPILVALALRAIRIVREHAPGVRAAVLMTTVVLIPIALTILWAPSLLEARLDRTVEYRSRRAGAVSDPAGETSVRRIAGVVKEIEARTSPDEPIFDFSNQPALYFFANRRNPTRFYQVPLMSPLDFQREVIRDLERDMPGVVVIGSPDGFDRFDAIANRDRTPLVASWIEHHYTPSVRVEGIELWMPTQTSPPVWKSPGPIPDPRDIALRPSPDKRTVFPFVGTIMGAGGLWSSDLFVWNPNDVAIDLRLRFVTSESIRERRWSVEPRQGSTLENFAESFFDMRDELGALWIIHDSTRFPIARVTTRRKPGTGRGIHAVPLVAADAAGSDTGRSSLLVTGFEPAEGERADMALVNFGAGPAAVEIRIVDAENRQLGQQYTTRIEEERPVVVIDLLGRLGTSLPRSGAVRIDVQEGLVASQLSIVDSVTGSADVISAVPIENR